MAISIARKNLLNEKLRLLISVGGVAFSVMLILIILALYRGWNEKLGRYVEEVDADVWVLQNGASDMFHSTSIFPVTLLDQLQTIDGIERVDALIGRRLPVKNGDIEAMMILLGYDPETGVGGPLEIVNGSTPTSGEIIIDEVLAGKFGLNVGDPIEIMDRTLTISGISRGGNVVTFQYAFVPMDDARSMMQMTGLTNYALIKFSSGTNRDRVTSEIEEQIPELHVLTKSAFADNNRKQIMEAFLPIIKVLVVIGFIVGLVVISLTIYTATIEKSREYGMLKAIGAKNRHLYGIIIRQSTIAGLLGFVVGLGLTFLSANLVFQIEPSFVTSIVARDVGMVFGFTLLMILLSAFIPIRRIVKIDPAIVFKT
ncbi:MAG: FtsX-like permease family protein [Candidatus Kerfeldbacteria bacterium]|nr:FtsX-like permease family protein [Candidatus Kerfeldbacteria bacterium]